MRVSGFKKSVTGQIKVLKAEPGPTTLMDFGADTKSLQDRMSKAERVELAVGNAERPSNMFYKMTNRTMYWYAYHLMDYYFQEVSIASTIKHRIPMEALRYGIKFVPAFAFKCEDCGFEVDNLVSECPICKSKRVRKPDPTQLEYFKRPNGKSFLDEANDNGQPLVEVFRQYAESQLQNNEAYTLCVTGDVFDKNTGHLVHAYPLEFVNYDPKFVRYLYDKTGTPGTEFAYVRDNRRTLITLGDVDQNGITRDFTFYDDRGIELYPAYWQIGNSYGGEGEYRLYSQEEIYHDHWMEASMTYGRPIWLDMEDDLLTYHYIEKHNLKKYKFGYVRKIIVLPGFNDEDVEDITKGIADILAKNDNSIPIICLPPQVQGVAEMKAQTLELGTESAADLLQIKDEIRQRMCAHGGFPDIFAGDVEASGGMNNESQQITIFDRYLLGIYEFLDRQCRWIMSWFPMITDWKLIVDRPTRAITEQKKRTDMVQTIMTMKQLGHDYIYMNGEVYYTIEPMDQIMRREQAKMAAQQPMMSVMGGGTGAMPQGGAFPGDGAGPPEQGTARRANEEIDANKNDLEQTQRDSNGSMSL